MDLPPDAKIEYPCEWEYRIIGRDADAMRREVGEIVAHLDYSLSDANRKGAYLSLSLVLTVRDEEQRNRIFRQLNGQASVRMVI